MLEKKAAFTAFGIILILFSAASSPLFASDPSAVRLSGRILLQVQSHGEAWYVSPVNGQRYFLGRPADAFTLLRALGTGITDADLARIPVALADTTADKDGDGAGDALETALGTDPLHPDTDADGHNDGTEIEAGYDPLGPGKPLLDPSFAAKHAGRLFLQVEHRGEAWYVSPTDGKRHYLGRPNDAFALMRAHGLGISDIDLAALPVGTVSLPAPAPVAPSPKPPVNSTRPSRAVMDGAGAAIRNNDLEKAKTFFHADFHKRLAVSLETLDDDGRLLFGNALSGTELKSSSSDHDIYSIDLYFSLGGFSHPARFTVSKQADDSWVIDGF